MDYTIDLNTFADGGLAARFNEEMHKVLDNIADPNTDPKKARTVTLQIKVYGDDRRDVVNASVIAKSKLLPAKELDTKILMGVDEHGNVVGKELKSGVKGQMFLDRDGDVAQDDGQKLQEDDPNRVINLREKRS